MAKDKTKKKNKTLKKIILAVVIMQNIKTAVRCKKDNVKRVFRFVQTD